jgi:hypothetical protein
MAVAFPVTPRVGPRWTAPGRGEWLLLAASIACVLGSLAVAEYVLRSEARADTGGAEAMLDLHVPADLYGWRPRPGFAGLVDGRRTTINARGFRGPVPGPLRTGERRIVMVGDSVAFGWGVHDEETFSALLDSHAVFSVANLAVEGYGIDQSLLRLEREGAALQPSAVVLHFCLANDFVDPALPHFLYDGRTPKPYFRLGPQGLVLHSDHVRRPLGDRAAAALEQRLELFRRLRGLWSGDGPHNQSGVEPAHWGERAQQVMAQRRETVALTLAILQRMAATARAQGARFVIVVHPNRPAFAGDDEWSSELLRPGRLPGLTVIDAAAHYRARGLSFAEVALDGMGHLSPRGHGEVAALLRDSLL